MKLIKQVLGIFYIQILLIYTLHHNIEAQTVTGFYQDFNGGNISYWEVGLNAQETTYKLIAENDALKIIYNRTPQSQMWDNINFHPTFSINVSNKPLMTIRIKSNVNTEFAAKMVFQDGGDTGLKTYSIVGDNTWRTICLQYTIPGSNPNMNRMYFYFDGGSTKEKSGIIYLDDFRVGDSAFIVADYSNLERAIISAQNLISNTIEGNGEGEFPVGSKNALQVVLNQAIQLYNDKINSQPLVDEMVWNLYDACSTYERNVNAVKVPIVDSLANKQTRYLYLNLNALRQNSLLFGMQDATGGGYGWSGDDDRSDIKDVCGDYPALFSEDVNAVELGYNIDRMRYRLTNAYKIGAVISLVWHQYDPLGRGFYSADVNNERIVSTILPGGQFHEAYKSKLKKIALFLKSLRGINGEAIPVIFRPYHEHVGNWFWWGPAFTSQTEFSNLWRFTAKYLHDSLNVHNLLWAISPSLDLVAKDTTKFNYYTYYPGNNYVDIFGADYYWNVNTPLNSNDITTFSDYMHILTSNAITQNKLTAITEIGQQFLPTPNWFTDVILNPIKYDSLNSNILYVALWRNYGPSQFWAPYPGHSSVPNFLQFYDDPYTLFAGDLPSMYNMPQPDLNPPVIISNHENVYISPTANVTITVRTNERSYLRYSFIDQTFHEMPYQFQYGEGGYIHKTIIPSFQGQNSAIYVRAKDIAGNIMDYSVMIRFTVDTLETPIAWYDIRYPVSNWKSGKATIGSTSTDTTLTQAVRTLYLRKKFTLTSLPTAAAIAVYGYGGCAVYLNGREIGRYNLPSNVALDYNVDPTSGIAFNAKQFVLDSIARKSLVIGENIFAIESHALPPDNVRGFDAYFINQENVRIIPRYSIWDFFDKGHRPYDIKLRDINGIIDDEINKPYTIELYQNYPNPFNGNTYVKYRLSRSANVKLEVYDVLGRRVSILVDQYNSCGTYTIQWNPKHLATGVYLLRLQVGENVKTSKMLFIK